MDEEQDIRNKKIRPLLWQFGGFVALMIGLLGISQIRRHRPCVSTVDCIDSTCGYSFDRVNISYGAVCITATATTSVGSIAICREIKLISFRNVTKPLQMNVVTFYRSSVSLFGYVLNIASVTGTKAFIFKLPYKHHFGSLLIPLTVITHPGKVDWVCLLVFSSELHIHWGHPI